MSSKFMAFVMASCIATTTFGAKKPDKPEAWAKEPDSFMGIKLGGDIIYDLPECPQLSPGQDPKSLCREKSYTTNYYGIKGLPSLGLTYFYSLNALLLDRRIEYLYLSGNTNDFEKAKEMFISKYGRPSTSTIQQVKTKAGASFGNDVLIWKGQKVTISLTRYSDDINTFGVSVSNNDVAASAASKKAAKAIDDASKL